MHAREAVGLERGERISIQLMETNLKYIWNNRIKDIAEYSLFYEKPRHK
jgi:hypothetical protein